MVSTVHRQAQIFNFPEKKKTPHTPFTALSDLFSTMVQGQINLMTGTFNLYGAFHQASIATLNQFQTAMAAAPKRSVLGFETGFLSQYLDVPDIARRIASGRDHLLARTFPRTPDKAVTALAALEEVRLVAGDNGFSLYQGTRAGDGLRMDFKHLETGVYYLDAAHTVTDFDQTVKSHFDLTENMEQAKEALGLMAIAICRGRNQARNRAEVDLPHRDLPRGNHLNPV